MCGGTKDDPGNAAQFKATDFGEYVDAIARIRMIDGEGTPYNVNFMPQSFVRNVCSASRNFLGRESQNSGTDGGTRRCI